MGIAQYGEDPRRVDVVAAQCCLELHHGLAEGGSCEETRYCHGCTATWIARELKMIKMQKTKENIQISTDAGKCKLSLSLRSFIPLASMLEL